MSQQVLKCFAFWYYNFLYSPFPHPNSKLCFLLMGWVWGWGRGSVLYSLGNDSCPTVHKKHTPTYPTHERTDRPTDGTITKRNGLWEWGDSKFGCAKGTLTHTLLVSSAMLRFNTYAAEFKQIGIGQVQHFNLA